MKDINVDVLAEKAKNFGGSGKKIVISIALLIVLWIAIRVLNPFVLVGAGERGVVLNFGAVQDRVLGEGLHLRVPLMQKIALMDVRIEGPDRRRIRFKGPSGYKIYSCRQLSRISGKGEQDLSVHRYFI